MTGRAPLIVLASSSPRRREILSSLGLSFTVRPSEVPETLRRGEDPFDGAERLAREKGEAAAATAPSGSLVIAADTLVVIDGKALGKPRSRRDAARMLRLLRGRRHDVVTGLALVVGGRVAAGRETSGVFLARMSEREIRAYVASGEPDDKAGAYALQGLGGLFVERVEGSPSNVIGLPVTLLYRLAARLGLDVLTRAKGR